MYGFPPLAPGWVLDLENEQAEQRRKAGSLTR